MVLFAVQTARFSQSGPSVSVADALRLSLPHGTRVLYGHTQLNRTVSWARAFTTRPWLIGSLESGAMVILSLRGLTSHSEGQGLARLVEAFVGAGVSAVVLSDDAPELLEAAVEASAFPVL